MICWRTTMARTGGFHFLSPRICQDRRLRKYGTAGDRGAGRVPGVAVDELVPKKAGSGRGAQTREKLERKKKHGWWMNFNTDTLRKPPKPPACGPAYRWPA